MRYPSKNKSQGSKVWFVSKYLLEGHIVSCSLLTPDVYISQPLQACESSVLTDHLNMTAEDWLGYTVIAS